MNKILKQFLDKQIEVEKKESEQEFLIEQQLELILNFENYIKENYNIDNISYSTNKNKDDYPQIFINAPKKECLKIMYDCDINYMCLRANHENHTLILVLGLRP